MIKHNPLWDTLHWEHGYRCYGLWTADGERIACVGLPPPPKLRLNTPIVYSWSIDWPVFEAKTGTTSYLSQAKKQVKAAYQKLSST